MNLNEQHTNIIVDFLKISCIFYVYLYFTRRKYAEMLKTQIIQLFVNEIVWKIIPIV